MSVTGYPFDGYDGTDESFEKLQSERAKAERAKASAAEAAAAASFERSDTDGFLSQWASGLTARQHRQQAEIEENGGKWEFPALFNLAGNLVAAKWVETRYGYSWGILDSESPDARFYAWFNPSRAKSAERRQRADAAKGYQVGRVRVPAKAVIEGKGHGLSGSAWVAVKRTDGGFSRDAEIVTAASYEEG